MPGKLPDKKDNAATASATESEAAAFEKGLIKQ